MLRTGLRGAIAGCVAAAVVSGLTGGVALGQLDEGDVIVSVEDGKVVTGKFENDVLTGPWYVFTGVFGDTGIADFTADPGFDSLAGALPVGAGVGVRMRAALRVWDGDGQNFDQIPGERVRIERFSNSIVTPTADPGPGDPLPELQLGIVPSNGRIHIHPWYTLLASAGDGVYLLELEFWVDAVQPSDPFWIVFNQNASPGDFNDAVEWAILNLPGDGGDCPPDWNGDGVVDSDDLLDFLADWAAGNADYNGDGVTDSDDLLEFLADWAAGCP